MNCESSNQLQASSGKIITVFGTGRAKPDDAVCKTAYQLGRTLAQNGFCLANGGYGGTMKAAAKGAAQIGGQTIGVTCSAFRRSRANKYITRQIVANSLQERLDTLIKIGQAYVVLSGGTGTLLELAGVWELKNKGFLNTAKPIILVGQFWRPLLDLIAADDAEAASLIHQAAGPEEVISILSATIGKQQKKI